MKKIIFIMLVGLITYSPAFAQTGSSTATQNVNLNLSNAISISFASGSGNVSVSIGSAKAKKSGVDCPDQEMIVNSNKAYKVDVSSTATNFTYTGTATTGTLLPVTGALQIHITANHTGGTAPHGISLVDLATVATNILTNCNAGANETFTVKLKIIPGVTIAAGSYSVNLVYTATQL